MEKKGRSRTKVLFNNVWIDFYELSEITGVKVSTLRQRHQAGKSGTDLIKPARRGRKPVIIPEGVE